MVLDFSKGVEMYTIDNPLELFIEICYMFGKLDGGRFEHSLPEVQKLWDYLHDTLKRAYGDKDD